MIERYCEAHITVTPHPTVSFHQFNEMVNSWGWKASLFEVDEVDQATGMWFLSAREDESSYLAKRVIAANQGLIVRGYKVLRSKIERTLWDTKLGDKLEDL
jgi:hypothetical protein